MSPTDLPAQLFGATSARRLLLLKAAWPTAVGSDLARRSQVVALDGDLLRIRVPDAIWRNTLWRMRSDLLARLRRIAGSAAPYALGFTEGPVPLMQTEATPRARPVAPRPLPADLAEAAERIPDALIRERFCETVGRYLERFSTSASPTGEGEA